MADNISLTTLRDECKQRCDMENSSFISDSEWATMINQCAHAFYDWVIGSWGADYWHSSSDLTTSAGTDTVALPADFYQLIALDYVPSGGDPVELEPFEWHERNIYGVDSISWSFANPPKYKLRANNIWVIPTPNSVYTLRCHYVPVLPDIGTVSDLLNSISGWHEYIVLDCCIKALAKQESSTTVYERQLEACKERLVRMAPKRDHQALFKVRRTKLHRKNRGIYWWRNS